MLNVVNQFLNLLRYPDPEGRIFNCVISDISIVLRETTLIILDSIETSSPFEMKIMWVVSLGTMEITEVTQFEKKPRASG